MKWLKRHKFSDEMSHVIDYVPCDWLYHILHQINSNNLIVLCLNWPFINMYQLFLTLQVSFLKCIYSSFINNFWINNDRRLKPLECWSESRPWHISTSLWCGSAILMHNYLIKNYCFCYYLSLAISTLLSRRPFWPATWIEGDTIVQWDRNRAHFRLFVLRAMLDTWIAPLWLALSLPKHTFLFSIVHCRERHEYFSTRFTSLSLFPHLFVEVSRVRVSAECAFYRLDFTDTPRVFHRWCRSIHLPGLRAFQFCLRIFFFLSLRQVPNCAVDV